MLKSSPGKTAAVFSEPSKALLLLIYFFFFFLVLSVWKLVTVLIHPESFKNYPGCIIRISSAAWFTTVETDGVITAL